MKKAIIGFTGFVGSNLLEQYTFDAHFNSKNISDIRNLEFDEIFCAGMPGAMWLANSNPDQDLAAYDLLTSCLEHVHCRRLILFSTVAVYRPPCRHDEFAPTQEEGLAPYGQHRLRLERFIQDRFNSLTLRLPGLFGSGLKKNALFDLLNNNRIDSLNGASRYQYYNLSNLKADIDKAFSLDVSTLNLATEPIKLQEIALHFFGRTLEESNEKAVEFDMRSSYWNDWEGPEGYLYSKSRILKDLESFIKKYRSAEGTE